jgi:hypothetical protein
VISARLSHARHVVRAASGAFSGTALVVVLFATGAVAAATPAPTRAAASPTGSIAPTAFITSELSQLRTQLPAQRTPASLDATDDSSYYDRIGDSELAPDIHTTRVTLSGGFIYFRIGIANLGPGLTESSFLMVEIDSDRNDRTGCSGSEYTLAVLGSNSYNGETARLGRCINGNTSFRIPQGGFAFSYVRGSGLYGPGSVSFRVGTADIGTTRFRFLVASSWGDDNRDIDFAGPYVFGAASPPPQTGVGGSSTPPRTTPPVKVVPLTISRHADVRTEATGPNGAKVRYSPAQVRGAKSVSYSRPSGSVFPLGKTVVTVTARNGSRVARSSFTVRVVDTTPPQLGPLTNVTATLVAGGATNASYGPVVARDRVDRNVAVNCTPASGAPFNPGATSVACTARDRSGNSAGATYVVVVPMVSAPLTLQAATGFNWNGSALASATTVLTLAPLASADGSPVGYTWAATNGSISGNGGAASWARALAGSQPAPGIVTLTVVRDGTVETYTLAFP